MLCFRSGWVQLVDAVEIHTFVDLLSDILVKPLKYNFIVIASLLFSLWVHRMVDGDHHRLRVNRPLLFPSAPADRQTVQAVTEIALLRDAKGTDPGPSVCVYSYLVVPGYITVA